MKLGKVLLGTVAAAGLIGLGTSAASANVITVDQAGNTIAGSIDYAGAGGPLTGTGITFDVARSTGFASVDCNDCKLNFSTGSLVSNVGDNYTFAGGGSFELTGIVKDGSNTIASGTLIDGQFTGQQNFNKVNDTSGAFVGSGLNSVDNGLAGYFGFAPDSPFSFISTNISVGGLSFDADGSFGGEVTNADIDTESLSVPEPQELGIFGLGLALMIGSLIYRRRNGSNLG